MTAPLTDERLRELLRLAEAATSRICDNFDDEEDHRIDCKKFIAALSPDVTKALVQELIERRAKDAKSCACGSATIDHSGCRGELGG